MQAKRWESLCILAFSLPIVTAGQALRISVYTPAGTVNKYGYFLQPRSRGQGPLPLMPGLFCALLRTIRAANAKSAAVTPITYAT